MYLSKHEENQPSILSREGKSEVHGQTQHFPSWYPCVYCIEHFDNEHRVPWPARHPHQAGGDQQHHLQLHLLHWDDNQADCLWCSWICQWWMECIWRIDCLSGVNYLVRYISGLVFFHFCSGFELYSGFIFGVTEESTGLSVLRTFRLLRIIKLVRFLPNLRRQLIVMLRTMDNVAVFFGLLMLFIFIFRYAHSLISSQF